MRLVEHWWNGAWARNRKDVWLGHDGDRWHVWWTERQDKSWGRKRLNMTEADARAWVDHLIKWAPGPRSDWRLIALPRRRELVDRGGGPGGSAPG
jgi:hypothetical protein